MVYIHGAEALGQFLVTLATLVQRQRGRYSAAADGVLGM